MLCTDNSIMLILNFSKHYSRLLALNEKRFLKSSEKHFKRGD